MPAIQPSPFRAPNAAPVAARLPFAADTVGCHAGIGAAVDAAFAEPDLPLDELERDQILLTLAEALAAMDRSARAAPRAGTAISAPGR